MNQTSSISKKERVAVYVDGFNLYFGMMSKGWGDVRWLNVKTLAQSFLQQHQELQHCKYFTSRVSNNPDKQKRQNTYLEALEIQEVQLIFGHYQTANETCHRCGHIWKSANEKMTDVNIATHMIIDAYKDLYDTAFLISGDSDLVPPIQAIHQNFKEKRVMVAFPPDRHNSTVQAVARGSFTIGRTKLKNSQLEDKIIKPNGFILAKPSKWI